MKQIISTHKEDKKLNININQSLNFYNNINPYSTDRPSFVLNQSLNTIQNENINSSLIITKKQVIVINERKKTKSIRRVFYKEDDPNFSIHL